MKMQKSIEFMGFMMSVKGGLMFNFGRYSQIASIVCQWLQSLKTRFFVCMEVSHQSSKLLSQIREIERPTEIPYGGLLCDLLWSDPNPDIKGWGNNDRRVSCIFGSDVLAEFLDNNDLDLICRGHQGSKGKEKANG